MTPELEARKMQSAKIASTKRDDENIVFCARSLLGWKKKFAILHNVLRECIFPIRVAAEDGNRTAKRQVIYLINVTCAFSRFFRVGS